MTDTTHDDEWDAIMRASAAASLAHARAVADKILDDYCTTALDEWLMPQVDAALAAEDAS